MRKMIFVGGVVGIAAVIFVALLVVGIGFYFAFKPCFFIYSACITSESAIDTVTRYSPEYNEFVHAYPNSNASYQGNYSTGYVVAVNDKAELFVLLESQGDIEMGPYTLRCSDGRVFEDMSSDGVVVLNAIRERRCG